MPHRRHALAIFFVIARLVAWTDARADEPEDVRAPSSKAPRLTDPSVAGSVVDEPRLKAAGVRTSEVLREQPGVAVTETGGYGSLATAQIRGATSAQTPVYLGGIRLNDDVAGTADLSLVPPWLLRRIEIYRGNAPLRADRLSIGGAIFLEPRLPRGSEAGAGGVAGSFGSSGLFGWAGTGDRRASALVAARWEHARNDFEYTDDRGTAFDPGDDRVVRRRNADAETLDAWALGRAEVGTARLFTLVNVVSREQGVPGLGILPTLAVRSRVARELAGVTIDGPCATHDRCRLSSTTSQLVSRSTTVDPLGELFVGSPIVTYLGSRLEEALTLRLDLGDRVTLTFVGRGGLERLSLRGAAAPIESTRVHGAPTALFEWAPSAALVVRALAGVDVEATSSDRTRSVRALPSARLGGQLGHGAVVGLANVGLYSRSPTLGELFGISGAQQGNANLVAESGFTADVGARLETPPRAAASAHVEGFLFTRFASDLIAYRRSSFGVLTPYNVGAARVFGAELQLTGEAFHRHLEASLALTLLEPRDTSEGRTTTNDLLPFRSRLIVAPRITGHLGKRRELGLDDATLGVAWIHQSSRVADPAGLVTIPAQDTVDVDAALAFHTSALRLRVANVLDSARFDVVGYPLPGRSVHLAWEVRTP